jgi:hypothetical protein
MARVARPGGLVGGYVWDFQAELSPSGPFRLALGEFVTGVPSLPGAEDSAPSRLRRLFEQAGFAEIVTTSFEVTVEFPDFAAFWAAQTPRYVPTTRMIDAMDQRERDRLQAAIRSRVEPSAAGVIRYAARANAVAARAVG